MAAQTFSQRLKQLRSDAKMGVRELGRALDVTGMHISNMEKGKSMPSPELTRKIANVLNTDVDELLQLANQVDPEVIDVIQSNHQAIPSLLRSAKNLTPEQWEILKRQVEEMTGQDSNE